MWTKDALKDIRYLSRLRLEIDNLVAEIEVAIANDNEPLYNEIKEDIREL